MSTKRNYGRNTQSYNTIVACYEYKREEERAWNQKYIDEERVLTSATKINDLMHSIPKDVKWIIEEDVEQGALTLANHFKRTVFYSYEELWERKLPKEGLTNYRFRGGGGPFESINYHRGVPKEQIVNPSERDENNSDKDGIKIKLIINPDKNHYLQSAEMNSAKINDYCLPCMLRTSTAATVGAGDKSSRKTKGRNKREKHQLYCANGGEVVSE